MAEKTKISKTELEKLLDQDLSLPEVAEKLNTSERNIQYLTRKMNIKVDFRRRRKGIHEKDIVESYRQTPASITEISKKLGVKYATVRKIFEKYNLQNIYSQKAKYFLVLNKNSYSEIIDDLKNSRKSLAKIGSEHGVSRQWVHQIQKKNKIIRP